MSSLLQQRNSSVLRSVTATVALGALFQAMGCGERDDNAGSTASAPEPIQEVPGTDEDSRDWELPELDEEDDGVDDILEDEGFDDPLEDEEDSYEGVYETLTGAGSSTAGILLNEIDFYLSDEYGIGVDYSAIGDQAGKEDFLAGAVDFAVVTAPLTEEDWEESQTACGPEGAFHVPLAAAPVAVAFNLDGIEELNLDAETLAGVFSGEITSWDDDRIAEHNPDVDLPSTEIIPVHQQLLSGTNLSFSQFLTAGAGGEWNHEPSAEWPESLTDVGQSAAGSAGAMMDMEETEGAITYADPGMLIDNTTVLLEGSGGDYLDFEDENVQAFLDSAPRGEGNVQRDVILQSEDLDALDSDAYPAAEVYYGVFCTQYDDVQTADLVWHFGFFLFDDANPLHDDEWVTEALPTGETAQDALAAIAEVS